jgi:hypothetical protein
MPDHFSQSGLFDNPSGTSGISGTGPASDSTSYTDSIASITAYILCFGIHQQYIVTQDNEIIWIGYLQLGTHHPCRSCFLKPKTCAEIFGFPAHLPKHVTWNLCL